MQKTFTFRDKSFAIYGYGLTGKSVHNFLKIHRAKQIFKWDDFLFKKTKKKNIFFKNLDFVDFIVLSPGININNSENKEALLRNYHKIITDLDLFYLKNKVKKSIIITGTNGKSTTCSLVHHIFKKNKKQSTLAGNIGIPILSRKFSEKKIYVIEASSFQLCYSKYIHPNLAVILNIKKDHLDWHYTQKKYIESKMRVFINQKKNDYALLNNRRLKTLYIKKKLKGKLNFIRKNALQKNQIKNDYLKLECNNENLNFAYNIVKLFNINKKSFIKSLISFKGLEHRHELFLKFKNFTFINDSKATSFESTKYALLSNKNIIWILGGQPKKNDKIEIKSFKNKIIKAYIIGKHQKFFQKQIKRTIKSFKIKDLKKTVENIFKNYQSEKKITVLFSPASASYDQFKSFVERGEKFKKIVRLYAKKNY